MIDMGCGMARILAISHLRGVEYDRLGHRALRRELHGDLTLRAYALLYILRDKLAHIGVGKHREECSGCRSSEAASNRLSEDWVNLAGLEGGGEDSSKVGWLKQRASAAGIKPHKVIKRQ